MSRALRVLAPFLVAGVAVVSNVAQAAESDARSDDARPDSRLILVMLDGVRWQEVFRGADPTLAGDETWMKSPWADSVRQDFVDVADRPMALMPFVNGQIAVRGALIGNRDAGSCARAANDFLFSYPGYNEALTGAPDPRVNANDIGPNPNVSFLEWLNRQQGFAGRVHVAASWRVMDDILNVPRSRLAVNAGAAATGRDTPTMRLLDRLNETTLRPYINRLDAFTEQVALDTLRTQSPRVLFAQFEPDDFGHSGDYAGYLRSIHFADRFIRELWEAAQADPAYAGRTMLLVTVDHGRGREGDRWRDHGRKAAGSEEIWIGALGPGIDPGRAKAYSASRCATLSQVAATALAALGQDWRAFGAGAAPPLELFDAPTGSER